MCVLCVQGKYKQLEKRFDNQLKDNWGLETLVSVGESWLPAMIEQDQMGEATDVPVLKLFEFLVASICLFMIEVRADNTMHVPHKRLIYIYSIYSSGIEPTKVCLTHHLLPPAAG